DLPGRRDLSGGGTTTSTFLDLLAAHKAPSVADGSAVELYRTWVLEDTSAEPLRQWQPMQSEYERYAGAAPWGAPLGLRRAMSQWAFSDAADMMQARAGLPGEATAVQDSADRLDIALPDRLRQ